MTLMSTEHFRLYIYKEHGVSKIYDFIADKGYCFRDNRLPLTDEEGNEYFEYVTAFSLLHSEIDDLENYDCVPYQDGMIIR